MLNLDILGQQAAESYLEAIEKTTDKPSFDKQLFDAFFAGYQILKEPFFSAKMESEMLVDFMRSRDLSGDFEEYLNEQKVDGYERLINVLKGGK